MNFEAQFWQYTKSEERVAVAELARLFDQLQPVDQAFMLGQWQGGVFVTGHRGEQQLHKLRWYGKAFHTIDNVDPILSQNEDGTVYPNEIMGMATLRMVQYNNAVTATMVYPRKIS